jgi:hypothetical protein
MRIAALVVLAVTLAACGKEKSPAAPAAPTAEAMGAELATFPQLLVPISTQTWASMRAAAARNDISGLTANLYPQPYSHASVQVDGRNAAVLAAYTSVSLVPAQIPLQVMTVQQYLRAFTADMVADIGSVVTPRGHIFFTRAQLPDIIITAAKGGARLEDMPYSVVRGTGR